MYSDSSPKVRCLTPNQELYFRISTSASFPKIISSTPSLENVIFIKNNLKIQKGPYTKCETSSPINYMDSIQKLIINGGKTRKQTLRQIYKFIYFSRVASDRNTKSSGQTKICKFEFTILRKKNKITYNYFVLHTSGLC